MHFNRGPSGWCICKERRIRRFGSSWKVKSRGVCSIILGTSSSTGSCFCKFILLPIHPFFWGPWKPLARPSDPISLCYIIDIFLAVVGMAGSTAEKMDISSCTSDTMTMMRLERTESESEVMGSSWSSVFGIYLRMCNVRVSAGCFSCPIA